ncbi:MAG TPA: hypothetical protein VF318_08920 [Dehalococcoidales bacterium]
MFSTLVMLRIVFITAMINILSISLVLFSCRCMNIWKITAGLNKLAWFKRFFKWHCYLWYVLLPSIIIHAIFALKLIGIPF